MEIPKGWPTYEMVAAGFKVIHKEALHEKDFRVKLFLAMLEAAPTPPEQEQDEPVAELVAHTERKHALIKITKRSTTYLALGTPLYTHPDNSGLRKAAEETLNWLYGHFDENDPHLENLRTALEGK